MQPREFENVTLSIWSTTEKGAGPAKGRLHDEEESPNHTDWLQIWERDGGIHLSILCSQQKKKTGFIC